MSLPSSTISEAGRQQFNSANHMFGLACTATDLLFANCGKTHRSSRHRIQHKDNVLWSKDTEEYLIPETDISMADRRTNRKPAPSLPKRIHISSPTQSTSTTKHSQDFFQRQKMCHQTKVGDTHRAMQHTRSPNSTDRLLSSVKRSSECCV